MLTINFQARFVKAVENGLAELRGDPLPWPGIRPKRQTIRAHRRDGKDPKPGDWRKLFTGMRSKSLCRPLGEILCDSVDEISIADPHYCEDESPIEIVPLVLLPEECETLAIADGFESAAEMLAFFLKTHGLPFEGVLIRW